MPDQETVNRSTVDTSDRDLVEPDAPERDITEREVREPDAAESETPRERADTMSVAESGDSARPDPDAQWAPDDARNADAAADSRDAEAAQDADMAPESTSDGAPADQAARTEEPGPDNATGLAPGDVPAPQATTLWAGEDSEALRQRWREVQARFVDDPHAAAAAADDLVGEAVETITGAMAAQRQQLGQWRAGGDFDTERLRVAVTGYRDFLDRVLSI